LGVAALLYAEILDASTAPEVVRNLHHMLGMLQIQRFEVTTNDAVPDHLGSPALFGHLVGIQGLRNAGTTVCPVGAFKAGMKAVVAMSAIAMAVAGHLMHHSGSFGRCSVGFLLGRRGVSGVVELFVGQDRRQNFPFGWGFVVEGWNIGLAQLGLGNGGCKNDNESAYRPFHNDGILLQNAEVL
jgi:hypothetical protein